MIDMLNFKKHILDLAIKGKLLEQNPNDASVEIFLASAKEEKKVIAKKYKGKKRPLILPISDVPFLIPTTWKWIRLGEVVEIFGRIGFRGYTKQDIVEPGQGAISFSPSNITDGKLFYDNLTYISWEKYEESPEIAVNEGDVILCKTASIGKTAKIIGLKEKATINPQLVVFKDVQCNADYLLFFLLSSCAQKQMVDFTVGTSIPTFTQEKLANMLFAFPPIDEQNRIAKKVSEIFTLLDKIDANQDKVSKLGKRIKIKVLEAAIRGKLVEKMSDEGDADTLFRNIQTEKQNLIKEGKAKKAKAIDFNQEIDVPFEIPAHWKWVNLSSLCYKIFAGGDKPSDFVPTKDDIHQIPVIANGTKNDGILGYTAYPTANKNSITVAGRGTIGFSAFRDYDFCPIVRLLVLEPSPLINPYYLLLVLNTLLETGLGTSIPQLTVPMLAPKAIPLPPKKEQDRIVEKVNEIFRICDSLIQ